MAFSWMLIIILVLMMMLGVLPHVTQEEIEAL